MRRLKSQIATSKVAIPLERIERRILLVRGQKVMLDVHLAELYGVETKTLNRAVKRNRERFPPDFMLQLTPREFRESRFQFGTSSWGGRRYLPYAFTEQGVAMLSSVLRSERAVQVNIAIMRAFVRLRVPSLRPTKTSRESSRRWRRNMTYILGWYLTPSAK